MRGNSTQPNPFYNRMLELEALDRAWKRRGPDGQMLLLYGRRRRGKTFLLHRYFTVGTGGDEPEKPHCYFLSEQSTAATQRLTLARRLVTALPTEGIAAEDIAVSWNALLRYASQQAQKRKKGTGRFALILDEFPYLVAETPELPSVLQSWWDREGVHAPLFVVLCGSQVSSMAALGQESAPLFGRFNGGIFQIDPLDYEDVACFYEGRRHYGVREKLLMYGVLGGTPRYHALVDPSRPSSEEIVRLFMQPRAVLENEVRFLLSLEQIRHPARYNAILAAIAGGETRFNRIQESIGVEHGTLAFSLRTLLDLGWVRRELPFGEHSEGRALYRVADPFLAFWYRFIAPLTSQLQFSDPAALYISHVAPGLADYMGSSIFPQICAHWVRRYAKQRLGLIVRQTARYASRDGRTEMDLVGELECGTYLFGECKWRADRVMGLSDFTALQAKVASLPEPRWRNNPNYILFAPGGFSTELHALSRDPAERLHLIAEGEMLASTCRHATRRIQAATVGVPNS